MLRLGNPATELERYEHERQAEWAFLLGRTGALAARPGANTWVAGHRRRLLPCLPASGTALAALAGQLGLAVEP